VAEQYGGRGFERVEAQSQQYGHHDDDGNAEAGDSLEHGGEQPGQHQELDERILDEQDDVFRYHVHRPEFLQELVEEYRRPDYEQHVQRQGHAFAQGHRDAHDVHAEREPADGQRDEQRHGAGLGCGELQQKQAEEKRQYGGARK